MTRIQTDKIEICPKCKVGRSPLFEGQWCPTCGFNPICEQKISTLEERVRELRQELDREITYKEALEQAESRLKKLVEGIGELPSGEPQKIQEIMIQNNFVIDNLDDRWQKLCFTIYSHLVMVSCKIEGLQEEIQKEVM